MLCPNCGTKTTTEHKFCRNCGMNLEPVSRALAAHLSHGGAAAAARARESERRNVQRMTGGLLAGVFVVLFGMLLIAFLPGKAFKMLGLIAAALGIVFSLAYERTGTIGTAIVAHGAFNLNNLLVLLSGAGK